MKIELNLKDIAEGQGHNLNYLILNSGVSVGTVRNYWYNKVRRVDLDVLERFCVLLNVQPCDLVVTVQDTE